MKCKCGSSQLKAYNPGNWDYILNYSKNKWAYANPKINYYVYFSRKPWGVLCLDCNETEVMKNPSKIYSANVNQYTEITLDLDHTLLSTEFYLEKALPSDISFSFALEENKYICAVTLRPYLKDFIDALSARFEKINIFTSATREYTEKILPHLHIPSEKLGFVKTREFTTRARSIQYEMEYLKSMNNSLIVEDKPEVVKGYNNVIFKVSSFRGEKEDTELLDIISKLNQKPSVYTLPELISGEVELFLRHEKIKFRNMPSSIYGKILKFKTPSKEELERLPVRTSPYNSFFHLDDSECYFSIIDLNYSEYVKLFKLIKPYTTSELKSKEEYVNLISRDTIGLNF